MALAEEAVIPQWDHMRNELGGSSVWKDKGGIWPSNLDRHVGKVFYHPKTKHLYITLGLIFHSEDEQWCLAYRRVTKGGLKTGPLFVHRPDDFFREGRFLEVEK